MLLLGFIIALFISVLGWWIVPLMIIDYLIAKPAKPEKPVVDDSPDLWVAYAIYVFFGLWILIAVIDSFFTN